MDPATETLFKLVELQSRMLTDALARLSAQPPAPSPVAQLRELVEVIQLSTPPAPAPPVAPTIVEGGPVWMPIVARALEALERISTRQAVPAAATTSPAPPAQPEGVKVTVPRWLAPIVPYIRTLCTWADANVRPELRAQIVAEELDPASRAMLAEILTADGFPSSVTEAIPDFKLREAWFIPFLYALRAAIVPQLVPPISGDGAAEAVLELDSARDVAPGPAIANGAGTDGPPSSAPPRRPRAARAGGSSAER